LAWLLLSNFSRRAEKKVRAIFIDRINGGGLSLLNELVVDYSGKEIIAVLKLLAEKSNYPVALYCTAGKDRTGLIAMLTLSVLGATDEEILADYVLSDSAYKEIGDKKAMVVGMKQTGVDPDIFLRAKPQVMKDTISYIRSTFGSINGFLDSYGFDESWRMRLRSSLIA
jgi:protein tyrosine/serine phosphatase